MYQVYHVKVLQFSVQIKHMLGTAPLLLLISALSPPEPEVNRIDACQIREQLCQWIRHAAYYRFYQPIKTL